MHHDEIVQVLNTHPVVQRLLAAPIPARFGYVALDGSPRVVPLSYVWDGSAFVFASDPTWPKVRALEANPRVAITVDTNEFPPHILYVRGTASIEYDQGLPETYVEGSRRLVGEDKWEDWEREVRAQNRNMAVIRVTPTWVKVVDFVSTFPGPSAPQD